jgi:hypothetical protein
MAYKFDPVISTYVDPKSIEISKTLNDRYAQNFAVNDALNTAMRDMQFAPFENDTALAKELRQSTDAKLQQIAERGDYENMTFPLHSIAKETGNMLKPLADNYSRYQTTLTDLNKRMQDGKVNPEQYDLYKSYMTRGYKGLELDEYGRAKEGTAFFAPTLYNDPKVMDRITERLKIIHSKKTGNETSGYQRDAEGNLLAITQGGTLEKVDQADVQAAVDAVMQESDVKMYFDQMGTMKTYRYSDAMGGPQPIIEKQATSLQDQIGKLNDAMNSGQYSGTQKKQMAENVKNLQNELTNIQGLKTPEEQLEYAKKLFVEEYQRPIYEYANLKAGVYEQTSKYSVKNITAEEKEKKQIEWDLNHRELLKSGEILATQWGGKDTNEKLQNIQGIQTRIQELNDVITTGKENGVALSSQVLQERRAELEGLKNDRLNTEAQIKEGARKSISYNELQKQDPTLIDALSEYLGTKDVGTIYLKMQQIFDNTGDQDYLNFQTKFNQKYGENALTNHQKEYYSGKEELNKSFNQDSEQIAAENLGFTPSTSNITQSDINSVFKSAFQSKVDKGLSEVKIGGVWSVNRIPGITPADTRAFTTAFDNLLLNKPLSSDIIYKDASGNEITNIEGATIIEYNAPVYGTNLMSLNIVQGDNKTPKTIYMDMNQITSPQLKQIYNSNSFKLASRMTQLGSVSQYDLKLNTINTQNGDYGIPFTLRFNDTRGNGKPLVTVLTNDGKPVPANWFTDRGMAPITKAVDPNSELFKDFIEKPFLQVN